MAERVFVFAGQQTEQEDCDMMPLWFSDIQPMFHIFLLRCFPYVIKEIPQPFICADKSTGFSGIRLRL